MKVSVVVITCNLEKYLDEAIQSVLTQTRKPDEIIIADDYSTDGTDLILQKYGNSIIHIKQKQNVGALRNTLAGLKATSHNIVAFLDADDIWMPEKLEETIALFEENKLTTIVSHDHMRVNEQLFDLNITDDTNENVIKITQNNAPEAWSNLFRRSILLRTGYWFGSAYVVDKSKIDFRYFENIIDSNKELSQWSYLDMVLGPFITASNPMGHVGFVNKKLFKYRIHTENTSGNNIVNKDRTLQTLKRVQSVNRLTYKIIKKFVPNDNEIIKRFAYMDNYSELFRLQYEGKKISAIQLYLKILPLLIRNKLFIKETKRIFITTFIGVEKFLQMKKNTSIN